jgi:hypothetical protein
VLQYHPDRCAPATVGTAALYRTWAQLTSQPCMLNMLCRHASSGLAEQEAAAARFKVRPSAWQAQMWMQSCGCCKRNKQTQHSDVRCHLVFCCYTAKQDLDI